MGAAARRRLARTLRPLTMASPRSGLQRIGAWAIAGVTVGPTLGALYWAAQPLWQGPWLRTLIEQAVHRPWLLTLWTATASTLMAVALCNLILSRTLGRGHTTESLLLKHLGWALATPHLAFALALGWLIAPTGLFWRLLSQLTGWPAQPLDWSITHDPWALSMVAVLVMKELPFLLWVGWAEWQRPDQRLHWQQQWACAQTWGYNPWSAWQIAVSPSLWLRLRWPVLAVWAYGWGVVDVGLAIGPTAPPTAAVLAWQWLHDANPDMRRAGVALSWMVGLGVAIGGWALLRWMDIPGRGTRWALRRFQFLSPVARIGHDRFRDSPGWWQQGVTWVAPSIAMVYAIGLMLTLGLSFVPLWPYPALFPESFSALAWHEVARSTSTLTDTITLALGSTLASMLLLIGWLESASARWQWFAQRWALVWLICPPVLWLWGIHGVVVAWGVDASWTAVFVGHVFAVLPYVLLTLGPAYANFDPRFTDVAATLGKGWWSQRWHIKWPMLRAPLWRTAAIGCAVSLAQYLPTEWLGGGRISTLTTEALTQSSGGQRHISAAWALAQWVLPMLVFAWATRESQSKTTECAAQATD